MHLLRFIGMDKAEERAQWTLKRQVQSFIFILSLIDTVCGMLRYSIPEEMKHGSFVGNVALDLRLNTQELATRNARVVSEGKVEYCELNINTGVLFVNERIDREELCGQISECTLDFQVVLDDPFMFYDVLVEIKDINDNTPSFRKHETELEIIESTMPGARFPLESAHDSDIGSNSLQTYELSQNEHFILDIQSRAHEISYCELVLQKPLDREQQNELVLILSAVDGGIPRRSGTINIHVIVIDANDNSPVFGQATYKTTLVENSPNGTLILTVNATDIDEGSFGKVTYSFNHISDEARRLFTIDPATAEITATGQIDFEKTKGYDIGIQAKDSGGQVSYCKLHIEILDVNDNPPVISLKSLSSSVPEDSLPGTVVALINVHDDDSADNGRVRCSVSENVPFKLITAGKNYKLITNSALDREKHSEYNITITASDEGTPPLSSKKYINVIISDVNDCPPAFEKTLYTTYVMENNVQGKQIISVKATDFDNGQNAHVSYCLYVDNVQGKPLSSYVSINSENGAIFALRPFDYEEFREFEIHVKAQDGGSPPLTSNVTVKVFVVDQNDNFPRILYPKSDGSVKFEMLPQSAKAGYLVTKVVAVDADSGQNAWLSYQLSKAMEPGLFSIGLHNGEIKTLRDVTDKEALKHKLVIFVKDNGQRSNTATVTLHVVISDSMPEISEFKDFSDEVDQNTNLTLYLVISLVAVSSLFLVSIIALVSLKFCKIKHSRFLLETTGVSYPALPISYLPPNYAEVGGTGTLQQRYEVCLTTDSGKNEFKYIRPCTENASRNNVNDPHNFDTMLYDTDGDDLNKENDIIQQKPANTDWRFSQGQRPGPSGSQRPEEAGPWPNPPTEAEQLQALMAAANEVSAATATLDAGTMGLSTRYSPQFTLQHVPDYRQNVYIPGSTSTLTGSNSQAEGKNPQPSSGNKKKSGKKEKK
ncbi:protocadherin gamma-A4-like isoform X4 [Acipenser ruthenus]|uniref:protocadherin gamma-A4-like isoform X4 n=1 Tax=Acipenser ruthenus TaxID=7906 RepID=UPI002741C7EE|nr:protocadherin gamma-A4-like isoform X4 [Acipenser ruthenus]